MRTSLIGDAMRMAIDAGRVNHDAIFHSDHGTQYTSRNSPSSARWRTFAGRWAARGCWANAVAESFFATLKNEMYYLHVFPTKSQARFRVVEYIEIYYNRKRRHSSLKYRTPLQALTEFH